jgi:hypothetical protein
MGRGVFEPVKKGQRPFLTGYMILFEAGRCPLKLPRVILPFSIVGRFFDKLPNF